MGVMILIIQFRNQIQKDVCGNGMATRPGPCTDIYCTLVCEERLPVPAALVQQSHQPKAMEVEICTDGVCTGEGSKATGIINSLTPRPLLRILDKYRSNTYLHWEHYVLHIPPPDSTNGCFSILFQQSIDPTPSLFYIFFPSFTLLHCGLATASRQPRPRATVAI
jgi:hypothetical protein